MDFFKRALELKSETIKARRYLHKNAEVGLNMPIAQKFIFEKLSEYGLSPKKCGSGICASLGSGAPCLLLRADMDALPMREESGESFSSTDPLSAHACGHDMHAAMLLTSAKMLKENEKLLCGTVKFMFQPAEEILEGARNMIDHGILEEPRVDMALSFHTGAGKIPPGTFMFNSGGVMMSAVNGFRIEIHGNGGHSAYPSLAADPIRIAMHIYAGIESLSANEAASSSNTIISIGKIESGSSANIIPSYAVIEGTLRSKDEKTQARLFEKLCETAESTAKIYGGRAYVKTLFFAPPLVCDRDVTEKTVKYISEINFPNKKAISDISANASEDFAFIAKKVPSAYIYFSAGFADERGKYTAHHPKAVFNEDTLPIGASAFAHCAVRLTEEYPINCR